MGGAESLPTNNNWGGYFYIKTANGDYIYTDDQSTHLKMGSQNPGDNCKFDIFKGDFYGQPSHRLRGKYGEIQFSSNQKDFYVKSGAVDLKGVQQPNGLFQLYTFSGNHQLYYPHNMCDKILGREQHSNVRSYFIITPVSEDCVLSNFVFNSRPLNAKTPQILKTIKLNNPDNVDGDLESQAKVKKTETSTFTQTNGFTISSKSTAKFKVPFIGETEVEFGAETTNEWSKVQSTSKEEEHTETIRVKAKPNESYEVSIMGTAAEVDVPYTATANYANGLSIQTSGIWKGVSMINFEYTIKIIKK